MGPVQICLFPWADFLFTFFVNLSLKFRSLICMEPRFNDFFLSLSRSHSPHPLGSAHVAVLSGSPVYSMFLALYTWRASPNDRAGTINAPSVLVLLAQLAGSLECAVHANSIVYSVAAGCQHDCTASCKRPLRAWLISLVASRFCAVTAV